MTTENQFQPLWPPVCEAVERVVRQMLVDGTWGRYHGPHCDALRTALSDYHGVEHVHLCSSGTSAIELCLRAVNVDAGDEVILAAYDYKANFVNVHTLGAQPVLVDTLPEQPVIDPVQLEGAFTSKTKAIICSHLHGCLAAVDVVVSIARQKGVAVIEDACQVPGAMLQGRRAGTIGDVGALSFGGSKLLTAGRGGAVLTADATFAQRIRLYTHRGNDAYPLSEMQAAVLLPQLSQLDERNQQRQRSVDILRRSIQPASGLAFVESDMMDQLTAWYKVPLLKTHSETRDEFITRFREQGIAIDSGFPALHMTHTKSRYRRTGELPQAADLHHRLLTLHHPVLLTDSSVVEQLAERLTSV